MGGPFEPNSDHDEMRDVVRDFCAEQAGEPVIRRIMESDTGFDRALWRRLGQELGALGLMVPEDLGGMGQGVLAQALVVEEFGAALMTGPIIGTLALAIPALCSLDAADRLAPLLSGDASAAFAVPDIGGRFDPALVAIEAREKDGLWRLEGAIDHVIDAGEADILLVAARGPGGVGLYAVARGASGLNVEPLPVMDLTRRRASVRFADCPADPVADPAATAVACERAFLVGGALLAAEQAGAAGRILDFTTAYVAERVQFGRTVASFQAIKHRCADLLVAVEQARSVARNVAWMIDRSDPDAALYLSVARSICSDALYHVATASIQLHGGIGFTWEHPAHLYLKRAVTDAILLGSADQHREHIAAIVGSRR